MKSFYNYVLANLFPLEILKEVTDEKNVPFSFH